MSNESQRTQDKPEDAPAKMADEDVEKHDGTPETLLDLVLAEHMSDAAPAPAKPERIDGVVIGRLVAIGNGGEPVVELPGSPPAEPMPARAMVVVGPGEIGRAVALLFEGGDPARPVVMGLMHTLPGRPAVGVEADGQRLVLTGEQEIVLRCGKASITLTRAGKIILRGTYVLTRSSGVNRIQGGSVQIN